jgi:hypothetical protein
MSISIYAQAARYIAALQRAHSLQRADKHKACHTWRITPTSVSCRRTRAKCSQKLVCTIALGRLWPRALASLHPHCAGHHGAAPTLQPRTEPVSRAAIARSSTMSELRVRRRRPALPLVAAAAMAAEVMLARPTASSGSTKYLRRSGGLSALRRGLPRETELASVCGATCIAERCAEKASEGGVVSTRAAGTLSLGITLAAVTASSADVPVDGSV